MGYPGVPGDAGKIPEPVPPDYRPGLEHHPAPDPGPGIADHPRPEHAVLADGHPVAEGDALREPDPVPQLHIPAQQGIWADADLRAERAAGADPGRRVDPRGGRAAGEELLDHPDQAGVRCRDDDAGSTRARVLRQRFGDQHRAGARRPEGIGVADRDRERQRLGSSPLERGHRAYRDRPIAKQAATDKVGDRLRGEMARGHALRYRT